MYLANQHARPHGAFADARREDDSERNQANHSPVRKHGEDERQGPLAILLFLRKY